MDRYATRESVRNLISRYFVSPIFLPNVAITLSFVLNSKNNVTNRFFFKSQISVFDHCERQAEKDYDFMYNSVELVI